MINLIGGKRLVFYYVVEGDEPARTYKFLVVVVVGLDTRFGVIAVDEQEIDFLSVQFLRQACLEAGLMRITGQQRDGTLGPGWRKTGEQGALEGHVIEVAGDHPF